MARVVVPLNFNAFLEKAKLKDDGSNYTDWVRNLRIILIAAQKNYVLEAPLGARPAAGATPDVVNAWQSKADDYSIVQCAMLYGLEPGLQRRFERHGEYEMFKTSLKPRFYAVKHGALNYQVVIIIELLSKCSKRLHLLLQ